MAENISLMDSLSDEVKQIVSDRGFRLEDSGNDFIFLVCNFSLGDFIDSEWEIGRLDGVSGADIQAPDGTKGSFDHQFINQIRGIASEFQWGINKTISNEIQKAVAERGQDVDQTSMRMSLGVSLHAIERSLDGLACSLVSLEDVRNGAEQSQDGILGYISTWENPLDPEITTKKFFGTYEKAEASVEQAQSMGLKAAMVQVDNNTDFLYLPNETVVQVPYSYTLTVNEYGEEYVLAFYDLGAVKKTFAELGDYAFGTISQNFRDGSSEVIRQSNVLSDDMINTVERAGFEVEQNEDGTFTLSCAFLAENGRDVSFSWNIPAPENANESFNHAFAKMVSEIGNDFYDRSDDIALQSYEKEAQNLGVSMDEMSKMSHGGNELIGEIRSNIMDNVSVMTNLLDNLAVETIAIDAGRGKISDNMECRGFKVNYLVNGIDSHNEYFANLSDAYQFLKEHGYGTITAYHGSENAPTRIMKQFKGEMIGVDGLTLVSEESQSTLTTEYDSVGEAMKAFDGLGRGAEGTLTLRTNEGEELIVGKHEKMSALEAMRENQKSIYEHKTDEHIRTPKLAEATL